MKKILFTAMMAMTIAGSFFCKLKAKATETIGLASTVVYYPAPIAKGYKKQCTSTKMAATNSK